MKEDYMIEEFKKTYLMDKHIPDYREVCSMIRFLATFSIGLKKMGLDELSRKFGYRLDCYVALMKHIGFKVGKRRGWRSTSGFDEILEGIFRSIRLD